jgi:5-methylcytosine-specific restriction endonuclease McrA
MNYQNYLQSDEWKKRRGKALTYWGHRCAICNSGKYLDVHHRTYANIGKEKMTDLIVLCRKCHTLYHDKLPTRKAFNSKVSARLDQAIIGTEAGNRYWRKIKGELERFIFGG